MQEQNVLSPSEQEKLNKLGELIPELGKEDVILVKGFVHGIITARKEKEPA